MMHIVFYNLQNQKTFYSCTEDRFFEAVFVKGENISDKSTLLTLAVEVGLPIEEMEQLLYSDAYGEAVNQDIQLGGQYGLRGVPFL